MRISDWSSDVCSSDLLNIQISPLVPDHLRNEFGRQRPPEGTPAPLYVEVLDQATDHCVATRLISNEWEYHILLVQSLHRSAELARSEEHTSELQSLMRNSYAVFSLNKKRSTINLVLPT